MRRSRAHAANRPTRPWYSHCAREVHRQQRRSCQESTRVQDPTGGLRVSQPGTGQLREECARSSALRYSRDVGNLRSTNRRPRALRHTACMALPSPSASTPKEAPATAASMDSPYHPACCKDRAPKTALARIEFRETTPGGNTQPCDTHFRQTSIDAQGRGHSSLRCMTAVEAIEHGTCQSGTFHKRNGYPWI